MGYLEIAIAKQHTSNKFFTYSTDEFIEIGSIVKVPYGKKTCFGIVLKHVQKPSFRTKNISQVFNYKIPEKSKTLLEWMFNFYPDDNGLITQLFIPNNLVSRPSSKTAKIIKGDNEPLPAANKEQAAALSILLAEETKRALLHVDTGTGKTRVFIQVAKEAINRKESVLILTPEIGLTPQLVSEIAKHSNAPVILYHSELTAVERRKIWEYASKEDVPTIFVGPRSSLFLPYNNLGLIVIDESHDGSYKQLQAPHYQSLHIAAKISQLHNAKLILSTATPNTEDYYKAEKNNYQIIRMKTAAAGNLKAENELVDLTERQNFTKNKYISDRLLEAIANALSKNEQVMVFLNRRGSARLIQCSECGWQLECPNCGLPLTFHQDSFEARCHSCSYNQKAISQCAECNSTEIKFKSIGTKALVSEIEKLFPKKIIMRFDADSLNHEKLHDNIENLKAGKIDIIVGTQLISKGIDLPLLTVVGVINADSGLNLPDFTSEEVTFQQLYQVTGRVGRGHKMSKSFIQTRVPEHPIMQATLRRSWEDFYEYEISKRKKFLYPPFCYLAIIKISKSSSLSAKSSADEVFNLLQKCRKVQLLGPSPSYYEKRDGKYTWQIILKSPSRTSIIDALNNVPSGWSVNIDPISLL
jgi:primosomal protein N' (replication factor Y)